MLRLLACESKNIKNVAIWLIYQNNKVSWFKLAAII